MSFGNSILGTYKSFFREIRKSSLGRKLIFIIGIKLIVVFIVLKIFFFKDYLNSRYNSSEAKSKHVIENLTSNKSVK